MQAPFKPRVELRYHFHGVVEASIPLSLQYMHLEDVRFVKSLQLYARELIERCAKQVGRDPAADGAAIAIVMRAIEESLRRIAYPPLPLS